MKREQEAINVSLLIWLIVFGLLGCDITQERLKREQEKTEQQKKEKEDKRLKREQEKNEQQKKEKEDAHLYTTVKVIHFNQSGT